MLIIHDLRLFAWRLLHTLASLTPAPPLFFFSSQAAQKAAREAEEAAERELRQRLEEEQEEQERMLQEEKAREETEMREREERRKRLEEEYTKATQNGRRGSIVSLGSVVGTVGPKQGKHYGGQCGC